MTAGLKPRETARTGVKGHTESTQIYSIGRQRHTRAPHMLPTRVEGDQAEASKKNAKNHMQVKIQISLQNITENGSYHLTWANPAALGFTVWVQSWNSFKQGRKELLIQYFQNNNINEEILFFSKTELVKMLFCIHYNFIHWSFFHCYINSLLITQESFLFVFVRLVRRLIYWLNHQVLQVFFKELLHSVWMKSSVKAKFERKYNK